MCRKFLCSLFLLTVLISCSSVPPEQARTRLLQSESCCINYKEIDFNPLTPYQPVEHLLHQEAVFQFPQGKSYFVGLKRPENTQFLEVTTWLNGVFITNTSMVYPLVTVLDQGKNPISTLRPKENWRRGLPIKPHSTRNPFYTARFTLPDDAHYLVVHADPAMHNEVTPYHHRAPNGANFYVDISFTVSGRLTLTFI